METFNDRSRFLNAQRPAGASFGRRRAGQRDQVRLLGAVDLVLVDEFSTPVRTQSGGEPLLDKVPAHALDSSDPSLGATSPPRGKRRSDRVSRTLMIKSELIERIAAQKPHLYRRDVEKIVNTILDTITTGV